MANTASINSIKRLRLYYGIIYMSCNFDMKLDGGWAGQTEA